MKCPIFAIEDEQAWKKARSIDYIRLAPAANSHSLIFPKGVLETLVCAIASHEMIHLSGSTGTGKTSLIQVLADVPQNFALIASRLGFTEKPLHVFGVEMVMFELPGELYSRRALTNGNTFDEKSRLIEAIERAASIDNAYPLIWLREMGRVHTANVQGGLLDIMSRNSIHLPDGTTIDTAGTGWIADSNYQAIDTESYQLVQFDDALKRRFGVNITLDYPDIEQETAIVHEIAKTHLTDCPIDMIEPIVKLGHEVRTMRKEGRLESVTPPTIYGYLATLRMMKSLPDGHAARIVKMTMLGNATASDNAQLDDLLKSGVFDRIADWNPDSL